MERNSILYKLRRKGQAFAHNIFSDVFLSKLYYRIFMKKKLNLKVPATFNEKLQWLKLNYYPNNDLVVKCTDKFTVRNYISAKGYDNILVPLLGFWENPDDIDWSILPDKFVLKCNHGCAYNILCDNKKTFDIKSAKKNLSDWLREDFGAFNIETHYSKIKNRYIICEEFLGDNITDYKFFCFNGKPGFLYISNDLIHDRQAQIGYFYLDGTKMPLVRNDYSDIGNVILPDFFNDMMKIAENLSSEFPFVRVDFFVANNNYYFLFRFIQWH